MHKPYVVLEKEYPGDGIMDSIVDQIGLNTILKADARRPLKITFLVLELKGRLQKTLNVTHVF